MTRMFWRFSCVCLLFVLSRWLGVVQAFDVAVYYDARSCVNFTSRNAARVFCGDNSITRQILLGRMQNEQDALRHVA